MTHEQVIVLVILYIFGVSIVVQEARLRWARKHIGYLEDLIKRNAATAEPTPPIKPIIFDQNKSVPKATDARLAIINPPITPIPILRNNVPVSIFRQFYLRLKCLSINKEQNLHRRVK